MSSPSVAFWAPAAATAAVSAAASCSSHTFLSSLDGYDFMDWHRRRCSPARVTMVAFCAPGSGMIPDRKLDVNGCCCFFEGCILPPQWGALALSGWNQWLYLIWWSSGWHLWVQVGDFCRLYGFSTARHHPLVVYRCKCFAHWGDQPPIM